MATFSKTILSGSTLIHTGPTNTAHLHEIWLYAVNTSASDVKLTIEWGAAASPDDLIEYTVKAENGLYLIIPGLLIKGNASALTVRAFAATTNVICISGYVNVIA
jgi:hypothetical protein